MKKQLSCLLLFSSLLLAETNTTQSDLDEVESNSKAIIEAKRLKEENRQLKEALMQSEIERLKVENAQLKNTQQPIQSTRLDASMPLKSQSNSYFGFGFGSGLGSGSTSPISRFVTSTIEDDLMFGLARVSYIDEHYSIMDVKYGIISSINNRFEFTFSYQTQKRQTAEVNYAAFDIDWINTFGQREKFLNLFVLMGLGINNWIDFKENLPYYENSSDNETLKGLSSQFGLGVLLRFDHSELEISYKIKAINWSSIKYQGCDSMSSCYDFKVNFNDFISYTYIGYKIYLD